MLIFAAGANGDSAPIATLGGSHTGINAPDAVAIDSSGKIYVANFLASSCGPQGSITVYAARASGDQAPITSVGGSQSPNFDRITQPTGVAVDGRGNIYASNDVGNGSVTVFAPGSTQDSAAIAAINGPTTQLDVLNGIAVDLAREILVSQGASSSITVYGAGATGNVAPIRVISGNLTGLSAVAAITLH